MACSLSICVVRTVILIKVVDTGQQGVRAPPPPAPPPPKKKKKIPVLSALYLKIKRYQ